MSRTLRVAGSLAFALCAHYTSRSIRCWASWVSHSLPVRSRKATYSVEGASLISLHAQSNLEFGSAPAASPLLVKASGLPRRILGRALIAANTAGIVLPWGMGSVLADDIEVKATPDDVRLMQGALSAIKTLGDFPSQSALADADKQITACIERWQARSISRIELSSLFRRRSEVRLRSNDMESALADLGSALQVMKDVAPGSEESFDELPKIYLARAETLVIARRWEDALSDYNRAADLLGEPIEDAILLSGRAFVKQKLNMMAAAAQDYDDSAAVFKLRGARAESEIAAEHAGIALIGAGDDSLDDAEERLCSVIRRSIGLVSKSVSVLQQVIVADGDARFAMAAVSWHRGRAEVAETYWRDAIDRVDKLYNDTLAMETSVNGFPGGVPYRGSRYASDLEWLRRDRAWPDNLVAWLQEFLRDRPGTAPRASYLQDLVVGKRPGDGSNLAEVLRARDEFRKVRGPFKLPDMDTVESQWPTR